VIGVIVCDSEGVIVKSTLNESIDLSQSYGLTIAQIVERAKQALKDNDELTFLKIRTKKHEFIVVPGIESNSLNYCQNWLSITFSIMKRDFENLRNRLIS
jgi:dynein light chain roadblock-type